MAGEAEMRARRCRAWRTDSRPARPAPRRRRSGGPRSRAASAPPRARRTPRRVAGVTLGQAIRRAARSTGSIAAVMRASPSIGRCPAEERHAQARPRRDRTDQPHRLSAALATRRWRSAIIAASARPAGLDRFRRQPCRARAGRHLQPAPLARGRGRVRRHARGRGGAGRGRGRDDAARRATAPPSRRASPTAIIWSTAATRPCIFVAIGRPAASDCHYPDIDLHCDAASDGFTHKDGTPYA